MISPRQEHLTDKLSYFLSCPLVGLSGTKQSFALVLVKLLLMPDELAWGKISLEFLRVCKNAAKALQKQKLCLSGYTPDRFREKTLDFYLKLTGNGVCQF